MSVPPVLPLILASVHLEKGPDAVPLGAACVGAALKAAFPQSPVRLVETFAADGAAALAEIITRACGVPGAAAGGSPGVTSGDSVGATGDSPGAAAAPLIAGFSLYSWNRGVCAEAAALIRARFPRAFLFCGGPEATALPAGLSLAEGGPFDAVIPGEGEEATVKLLDRFLSGGGNTTGAVTVVSDQTGTLATAAPLDLAALPSPWLDGTLDPTERPGILWELARGCPYQCAYCYESKGFSAQGFTTQGFPAQGFPAQGSRRVRYFPEERLRGELQLFAKAAAGEGKYVFVLDPTFNTDNKRALRILKMIEEEAAGLPIHWHFEARAELLTGEQARRFARLEASLQIGLQSSDPEVTALIGREFNPRQFAKKIGLLNQEGVSFGLDLIYGLPGDTLAGFKRSLDYAISLYPTNLDLFRLALLPGTLLFDRAEELGLTADGDAPYLVRETKNFSGTDLERAEILSQGAEVFYNTGRAVAWFNQALHPLRMRPSVFLEEFAAWVGDRAASEAEPSSFDAEKLQLAFLEKLYIRKKKEKLLPALRDIVRYHGAWGRALAEDISTELLFNYNPQLVLSEEALDLERFVEIHRQKSVRVLVSPEDPLRLLPR